MQDKVMSWGRKVRGEDLCDPLELGASRREGLQQVLCVRAGDKIFLGVLFGWFGFVVCASLGLLNFHIN